MPTDRQTERKLRQGNILKCWKKYKLYASGSKYLLTTKSTNDRCILIELFNNLKRVKKI